MGAMFHGIDLQPPVITDTLSGGPELALWVFMTFYAVCVVITWFYYTRRNAPVPC